MSKELIIFGNGKITEVITYYAEQECGYKIAAFTCDKEYIKEPVFLGKPLLAFEDIEKHFSPTKYDMFIAVGYHDLNRLREKKCDEAISKGYSLASVISPLANVPNNVRTGYNCFIMPPAIIHPCVELGNNVFVWAGALIGHHSKIADHNWFTSCANIGGNVKIGTNCFFAMNATVSHSISIGSNCFIGANALVAKSLESEKVVVAEPTPVARLSSKQFLAISKFSNV